MRSQAQLYKVYSLFVSDGVTTKFVRDIKACRDKYAVSKAKRHLDENAPLWGYQDNKYKEKQMKNSYIQVSFDCGYSNKQYQLKIE